MHDMILSNWDHLLRRLFFCRQQALEKYVLGTSFPFFSAHLRYKNPNDDFTNCKWGNWITEGPFASVLEI